MKKLTIGFVALVVTAVCSTLILSAKDRKTTIYMTKNYNPTGTIKSECIGVVVTDPLPAVKTDKITWQVKNGNGQNSDDDCTGLDYTKVQLRFKDDVMGAAAMKMV